MGVKDSLNDAIPMEGFYQGFLKGAQAFRSISMNGNTPTSPEDLGVTIMGENGGRGMSDLKPQSQLQLIRLFRMTEGLDVIAIGVDPEGAGSTFWVTPEKRVYQKGEKVLAELVSRTGKP